MGGQEQKKKHKHKHMHMHMHMHKIFMHMGESISKIKTHFLFNRKC